MQCVLNITNSYSTFSVLFLYFPCIFPILSRYFHCTITVLSEQLPSTFTGFSLYFSDYFLVLSRKTPSTFLEHSNTLPFPVFLPVLSQYISSSFQVFYGILHTFAYFLCIISEFFILIHIC